MKEYKLFLDDYRIPIDAWKYTGFTPYKDNHWKIVKDYNQFVSYITRNYEKHDAFPSIIGFDHDIADDHYAPQEHWSEKYDAWADGQNFKEKTGMDCAKWLVEFCMDNNLKLPQWFGHSMNPAGRENIDSYLLNYRKHEEIN